MKKFLAILFLSACLFSNNLVANTPSQETLAKEAKQDALSITLTHEEIKELAQYLTTQKFFMDVKQFRNFLGMSFNMLIFFLLCYTSPTDALFAEMFLTSVVASTLCAYFIGYFHENRTKAKQLIRKLKQKMIHENNHINYSLLEFSPSLHDKIMGFLAFI